MIRRVTGLEFDGSCTHITIGKTECPYLSAGYGDNLESEWIYEMGSQVAVAQTPGLYKTEEGTLKMRSSVARVLLFPNLPALGAGNAITQCVVNYVHPDIGADSDLLVDFRLKGAKAAIEASAKANEIEIKFTCRLIKWTSRRVCYGSTTGGGATGTMKL